MLNSDFDSGKNVKIWGLCTADDLPFLRCLCHKCCSVQIEQTINRLRYNRFSNL